MKSYFKYKNTLSVKTNFILEPWAEEYELLPTQEIMLIGEHEEETQCTFTLHPSKNNLSTLICHAWDHSRVRVFIDNLEIDRPSINVIF